ncbi:MAG: hypothetical protein WBB73_11120 [Candidatus Aminicenantaceae bacterium]
MRWKKRFLITELILFLILSRPMENSVFEDGQADVSKPVEWARTYTYLGNFNKIDSICATPEGGVIVSGASWDFEQWYLKLSSVGEIEWQFSGIVFHSISLTEDGNYIGVGTSYAWETYGVAKVAAKFDSFGSIIWARAYDTSLGEKLNSVHPSNDGGFIVAGISTSFASPEYYSPDYYQTGTFGYGTSIWLLKLDSLGEIEWQKAIDGLDASSYWIYEEQDLTVRQVTDGGFIIAATTKFFGAGSFDVWIIKVDAHGDIQWQRTYGGTEDEFLATGGPHLFPTEDGGAVFVCKSKSFGAINTDAWVVKMGQYGEIEWQRLFSGELVESACAIAVKDNSEYLIGGSTNSSDLRDGDFWLLCLDINGNIRWEYSYGTARIDYAACITVLEDRHIVIAGIHLGSSNSKDLLAVKVSPEGELSSGCGMVNAAQPIAAVPEYYISDTPLIAKNTNGTSASLEIASSALELKSSLLCWNLVHPPILFSISSDFNRGLFGGEAFHKLTWQPNPDNISFQVAAYRIYRRRLSDSDLDYEPIAELTAGDYTYIDIQPNIQQKFKYYITAVDSIGLESNRSDVVEN